MATFLRCTLMVAVGLSSSCAESQTSRRALIERRDAIRAHTDAPPPPPVDLASFRSAEGVRGASWGMTVAEVVELKGLPAQQIGDVLSYVDAVDGAPVATAYVFFQGKLAQVTSQFENGASADRLVRALSKKHGAPTSDYDERAADAQANADSDAQLTVALLVAIPLAVLFGLAVANSHGTVDSRSHQPWDDHVYLDPGLTEEQARTGAAEALRAQQRPPRQTLWTTKDSRVVLIGSRNGSVEVTWSSVQLGNLWVRHRASEAGIGELAKDL